MFLKFLQQQNPALIDFSKNLLTSGKIEPDCYVLDLDAILNNAARLVQKAREHDLSLYFMSKQIGRNPAIANAVIETGFVGAVCVDFREALTLGKAGVKLGHVGNLVQIPDALIAPILQFRPEVISVFSLEKAARINEEAAKQGFVQHILLRVLGENDVLYPAQEAGFSLAELPLVVAKINAFKNVRIKGVTSFPCFMFDATINAAKPTENAQTLAKAAQVLRQLLKTDDLQVNMPSCNSLGSLPLLTQFGGTHAEPGHALTGTSPDNPFLANPLIPAMLYVSEISHHHEKNSQCFGGGHYRRSHMQNAVVFEGDEAKTTQVLTPNVEAIDYHFALNGLFKIGSPVIMSFRSQIFVTRSQVAIIKGLSTNAPQLASIWDAQGNLVKTL